jgi:hypothetical protein
LTRALAVIALLAAAALAGVYYPAGSISRWPRPVCSWPSGAVAGSNLAAPFWGLAALLVAGVLAPIVVLGQVDICLLLAATAVGSWVVRPVVLRRPLGLAFSPVVLAALAFMSIAVLSFVVGQYPWFPTDPAPMRAQVGGLALFVLSGALFLTVGHQVRSVVHLERLTWLFIGAGGVFVAMEFAPGLPGVSALSALSDPQSAGSMFWVWLVALSFSQALCNSRLSVPDASSRSRSACSHWHGVSPRVLMGIWLAAASHCPLRDRPAAFSPLRCRRRIAGIGSGLDVSGRV